jgi:hypothetical protein
MFRNRVTPLSELIADPARGLVYGNRGCLHDAAGRIRRRYSGKRWIACRLEFRGWLRRPLVQPGRFTELFFVDDATALAAGHRPCALCRRDDYNSFRLAWNEVHPGAGNAEEIDAQLHAERVAPTTRAQRHTVARLGELPDGAFVLIDEAPWVVAGEQLLHWTPAGYTDRQRRRPVATVLLTPPSLVAVLAGGWRPEAVPFMHPSSLDTTNVNGDSRAYG